MERLDFCNSFKVMLAIHQAQIEVFKRFLLTPDLVNGHAALLCRAPQIG
jgi:hypothetical protein